MDVRTVPELLRHALETHRKPDAFRVRRGNGWAPVSMTEVLARVETVMAALRGRGVRPGDRVVILGESSLEWAIADMAVLSMGAVTVPFYHTLPSSQIAPLLVDCGAVGAFASTAEQRAKLEEARGGAPSLRWVWCIAEEPLPEAGAAGGGASGAGSGASADGSGPPPQPGGGSAPQPGDLATIIYTSGTTGVPKGVMLTHENFASEAVLALGALGLLPTDTYLSFLPLSHVFERCDGLYTMLYAGTTVVYAESFDRMPQNLQEVRPTIIVAVPRFYEKLLERANQVAERAGFPQRQIFGWARRVAIAWGRRHDAGRAIPPGLALQHALAGRLVYSKLARRLGERVRLRVSGGAALNREVAYFFLGAGQPIYEGYGLTETSAAICVNTFERHRIGTVGPPIPGVEVRIAEDGEIVVRGPVIMKGYWNRPEDTSAVLRDGWFYTGDVGELDVDGLLRITDRKKDVIVTSGGKKVAPQPIEGALKASPRISEALVLGEGQKFIGALIVAAPGANREAIAADVERVNASLAQFEQIRRFELIPDNLSVENGYLTPSLKLKRKAVAQHHRDLIARLFEGA
jgi:long-chain acyl-CoA synthetase